ncbi:hypothetical protein [Pectobacterium atrosepticum]|uniref:hypothetical protein n=1 Tax=Pectobacterium atrosepticum TaxID=29471 RepID=UPI000501CC7C|nr:hypothetical protein [Pectobacterium atrosepticum]KFX11053.1 hypothetical protein JV34_21655 [Pectobacterium atrosepticum]KMK87609.1 hypothetical protein KCQ_05196 [Pectobacterium atrosepticum ICMP 1526]QXE13103.1 hypothetical protein DCX48_00510 [Pectobacterium atrosepticum]
MSETSLSQQGISLLLRCQQLQSEKDGIKRPLPFKVGVQADEELDDFARQIQDVCLYVVQLDNLLAMQRQLVELGRQLEQTGKIAVPAGDSYADAAMAWFAQQCAAGAGKTS